MKKVIMLSLAAVLFFAASSSAQDDKMSVGINGALALPMGDFGDVAKMGFGGGVSFGYMMSPEFKLGLNVGLLSFGEKISGVKSSMIPIGISGNYYFSDGDFKPYGTVGVSYTSFKIKISGFGDATESKFGYNLGLGFESGMFDVSVKYNSVLTSGSATNYIGLKAGVNFAI